MSEVELCLFISRGLDLGYFQACKKALEGFPFCRVLCKIRGIIKIGTKSMTKNA